MMHTCAGIVCIHVKCVKFEMSIPCHPWNSVRKISGSAPECGLRKAQEQGCTFWGMQVVISPKYQDEHTACVI
jgi:hypothetical protein